MPDETIVNAQEIMLQIEQQIWAERDDQDALWIPDLDPHLRTHLVRLREMAGGLQLEPMMRHSSLPVVGPLITWWRTKVHQLVLYYINNLTRQQVAFEQTVTRTIIYLAERYDAENKALRAEIEDLRQELAQVRAAGFEE